MRAQGAAAGVCLACDHFVAELENLLQLFLPKRVFGFKSFVSVRKLERLEDQWRHRVFDAEFASDTELGLGCVKDLVPVGGASIQNYNRAPFFSKWHKIWI